MCVVYYNIFELTVGTSMLACVGYAVMIYLFRDVLRILKRIVYFRSKMSRNMIFRSLFRNSYVCFKTLYFLEEARNMILYDYSSNKTIKKSTR